VSEEEASETEARGPHREPGPGHGARWRGWGHAGRQEGGHGDETARAVLRGAVGHGMGGHSVSQSASREDSASSGSSSSAPARSAATSCSSEAKSSTPISALSCSRSLPSR